MNRYHVRWPALALGVALILTLTMAWVRTTPRVAVTPPAQDTEGPSMLTDAQGRFRFDGLHNSSHILRLDPQSLPDFKLSPDRSTLTLSPGVTRSVLVAP